MIDERLLEEETGIDIDPEAPWEIAPGDVRALRSTMIRVAQLEREADATKALRDDVRAMYDEKIGTLDRERERLRRSLAAYVERNGSVKFPDVGTAYLATGDAKIEVVDDETFKGELGDLFTKPVFDLSAAKRYALEQATTNGEIVPGTQLVPGGPRLQIRKA